MQLSRVSIAAILLATAPLAFAQWQWLDKDGRKVFSDHAPPPEVPAKNILRQPGMRAAAAPVAAPAASAPAAPKVAGKDKELQERNKQAAAAEAEKKKAQDEEVARMRAENCRSARQGKAQIDSGVRMVRVNDKGEREYMDEAQIAAEAKRLDAVIARECASGG